jgi:hypothetical protein
VIRLNGIVNSPVYAGNDGLWRVLAGRKLLALDPATGVVRSEVSLDVPAGRTAEPLASVSNDQLYFTHYRRLCCVGFDGRRRWEINNERGCGCVRGGSFQVMWTTCCWLRAASWWR